MSKTRGWRILFFFIDGVPPKLAPEFLFEPDFNAKQDEKRKAAKNDKSEKDVGRNDAQKSIDVFPFRQLGNRLVHFLCRFPACFAPEERAWHPVDTHVGNDAAIIHKVFFFVFLAQELHL
ncbi:MAG TPA: hypothetical protein PK249_03970 [Bacillota bacterium]|jgi:hypothetical protein|nr:hypothetical protein [Bacillota bacterium]